MEVPYDDLSLSCEGLLLWKADRYPLGKRKADTDPHLMLLGQVPGCKPPRGLAHSILSAREI